MAGIGAAALAGGGVFGGLAVKARDEFDDAQWASDALEKKDIVEQRSLVANILFGVGGAAMISALVLFFTEGGTDGSDSTQKSVQLDVGLSGITATVRF